MPNDHDQHRDIAEEHGTVFWVLAAFGGLLVHFVVSVTLLFVIVSSGYRFASSIPGGGEVSSFDQLYKLGPSPGAGLLALALIGLLSAVGTLIAAASRWMRRRAWLIPPVGILLSVLAVAVSVAAFIPPAPEVGG